MSLSYAFWLLSEYFSLFIVPLMMNMELAVGDVPCDHILISDNVNYQDFEVIDAPVSDHCALTVKINF